MFLFVITELGNNTHRIPLMVDLRPFIGNIQSCLLDSVLRRTTPQNPDSDYIFQTYVVKILYKVLKCLQHVCNIRFLN